MGDFSSSGFLSFSVSLKYMKTILEEYEISFPIKGICSEDPKIYKYLFMIWNSKALLSNPF